MIDRDVRLDLGDKHYMLSPTLGAMLKVNRGLGSVVEALNRTRSLDFEAVCNIIAAGAALTPKQIEKLKEEVFAAGIVNVVGAVADFLAVLLDPNDQKETDE